MKTSIIHILSLSLVLSFAAACGKKGGSGGGSSSSSKNNFTAGNFSGTQAYNNLKKWYDGAETATLGSTGIFHKKEFNYTGFNGNISICIPGIITSGCDALLPSNCYVKVGNAYALGQPKGSNGVYSYCEIYNPMAPVYSKANNTALKEAVLGRSGLTRMQVTQSGSLFTISYGQTGAMQPSVVYQVNTTKPSMVNPTLIRENNEETVLLDFRVLR